MKRSELTSVAPYDSPHLSTRFLETEAVDCLKIANSVPIPPRFWIEKSGRVPDNHGRGSCSQGSIRRFVPVIMMEF